MNIKFFSFILLSVIISSCAVTKSSKPIDVNPKVTSVENVIWDLTVLDGKTVKNNGAIEDKIHFILNSQDSTIIGYSGCNRFFGKYEIQDGSQIQISQIGSTKRACHKTEIKEHDLFSVLHNSTNFTIVGNSLQLNVGKRAPLAEFRKRDDFAQSITGKYWKLLTLDGKKVTMGKNQKKEQYFKLNEHDSTVSGFGGCNGFGGNFELEEGNIIKFSKMLSTLMHCDDLPTSEQSFLDVFETANNYTIHSDTLSLNVGKRAPLATFVAVYF